MGVKSFLRACAWIFHQKCKPDEEIFGLFGHTILDVSLILPFFKLIGELRTRLCRKSCIQECVQSKYPVRSETVSLLSAKHRHEIKKIPGWNKPNSEIDQYIK